jgi:hypothetical protein
MRALLIPLAAGALLAAAMTPAQAAAQAVGDVQLLTAAPNGLALNHTIRYANGTWQPWGQLDNYEYQGQLASVMINGVEHVFTSKIYQNMPPAYTYDHLIRDAAGNWTQGTLPPGDGWIDDAQAVANLNGHIALVRKLHDVLSLSIQQADSTWSAWETLPTGPISSFSVTANGGVLRMIVSTSDGTKIGDYERAADGTWSQPAWVPFNGGTATQVAVAQVGTDLQVAAVAHNGDRYEVWHSLRHANGNWDQFGYVEGVAGDIPAVRQIAVTNSRGTLQLVASTMDYGLFHTIRYANGTWQRFGDITSAAGKVTSGDVTLAGQ